LHGRRRGRESVHKVVGVVERPIVRRECDDGHQDPLRQYLGWDQVGECGRYLREVLLEERGLIIEDEGVVEIEEEGL
jgi:hypothetical protein